ncbi:acyl carrier protein [Comamonas sp. J-3]|uniref:acyl carrier protein n=1 Tax=Comamonas trifloxystrobinivorans TaxID=3350256 RepID=UPI00372C0587
MDPRFEKIRSIVAEVLQTDSARIAEDTPLLELPNIDSLSFEMIIVSLEMESGRDIAPTELLSLQKAGDLARFLPAPLG